MESSSNLALWITLWMIAVVFILYAVWKKKAIGAGLVLAYVLNLSLIHLTGAAIYILPWQWDRDPFVVEAGFRESTYGMIAFATGVMVAPFMMKLLRFPPPRRTIHIPEPRQATLYIAIGMLSYLVLMPYLGALPTLSALLTAAWSLTTVGLALSCWKAWHDRRRMAFSLWLMASLSLPIFTLITQGFVSIGTVASLAVLGFVATFLRPRWKVIAGGLLLGFLGLSVFVAYMKERTAIREIVWGAQSFEIRYDRLYQAATTLEWFNPNDETHLSVVDARLNQNHLIGTSVYYMGRGHQDFAGGETLWQALSSLVPRAFWPNKPVVAGSMGLVSEYTGIRFARHTSVGIGQILEFYINFGSTGIVLGLLLLGIIMAAFDRAAGERLSRGDWSGFAFWFLPGLAFLQVGGSLVDVASSAGAAFVTVFFVNNYLLPHLRSKKLLPAASGVRSLVSLGGPGHANPRS